MDIWNVISDILVWTLAWWLIGAGSMILIGEIMGGCDRWNRYDLLIIAIAGIFGGITFLILCTVIFFELWCRYNGARAKCWSL